MVSCRCTAPSLTPRSPSYLLLTTHYLLRTTYHLPLTISFLNSKVATLPTTYYSYLLLTTCYLLLTTYHLLPHLQGRQATYYLLLATCYLLLTTYYLLLATHYLLLTTDHLPLTSSTPRSPSRSPTAASRRWCSLPSQRASSSQGAGCAALLGAPQRHPCLLRPAWLLALGGAPSSVCGGAAVPLRAARAGLSQS